MDFVSEHLTVYFNFISFYMTEIHTIQILMCE